MGTFKLALKTAKKANKNTLFAILIIVLVIILATTASIVFLVIKPVCDGTDVLSTKLGETTGIGVALAIEPYLLPFDAPDAADEGREQGESGDDTSVDVEKQIESLGAGVLEVLKADTQLYKVDKQGEDGALGVKYAALYKYQGTIIFKIDLNDVDIDYEGQIVTVTIPKPICSLDIDPSSVKLVTDFVTVPGYVFTNGRDAIVSSLNTEREMLRQTPDKLNEYQELFDLASEEAVNQIKSLAEAVIINKTVVVKVQGE